MGTVKKSEPAGDEPSLADGEFQPDELPDKEEPGEPKEYFLPEDESDKKELPTEPPLIWTIPHGETPQVEYDPASTLTELRNFYLYGQQSDTLPPSAEDWPTPALLYPHRDLSQIRYDYPMCVPAKDPNNASYSLTEIIDDLIAGVADEATDDGQRLKRHLYQLESEIKSLADKVEGARLTQLWDRAAENLISSSKLPEEKKKLLREDLAAARSSLQIDGEMLSCSPGIPDRLFTATMGFHWRQKCEPWREDLDFLINGLQDIIATDINHSPQAKSPDSLRASVGVGGDDLDFDTMSLILSESQLGEPMTETRRERVQNALTILLQLRPLFQPEADKDAKLPFDIESVVEDCASAVAQFQAWTRIMVDFFKAVYIARLEIANRYREAVHDDLFNHFDVTHLTDEELSLCPPVLLSLKGDFLTKTENQALLDLLNAGLPIKVLVHLDDLAGRNGGTKGPSVMLGWQARLGNMTMALGEVYVLQTPVSNLPQLQSGLLEGFHYQGPALFNVYTGTAGDHSPLPIYFQAAAATESRAFPVFKFDPGKGSTQAERIDIFENPQNDRDWPADEFQYRNGGGEETTKQLIFTLADFLACDRRLAEHFWLVPSEKWHENMMPLGEFLQLDDEDSEKIPYLAGVDGAGRLCRVVMTREVLASVAKCGSYWRNLQEMGGINNSFALNLLAKEKQNLEEEKQREIEAIEQKYSVELDRDISGLTNEIVQRIANQLVAEGTPGAGGMLAASFAPAAPPVGAPATAETAPTAEDTAVKEAVEEEEEEELTFDEPYIDTPLCTTCNECTNLNGQMFAYNENKQAFVADPNAGTFAELVTAAEKCPVHIIHPGKPKNPSEANLDELTKRAAPFN